MNCTDLQQAIASDEAGEAARAHLSTCAACQTFEAAHQAARRARNLEPRLPTRVQRSAVTRRAALVAVVVLIAGAAAVVTGHDPARPDETPAIAVTPTTPVRPETSLSTAPSPDEEEWAAFVSLSQSLDTSRFPDVTTSDATYAAFGALPRWLAPSSPFTALEN